eukprot:TRINITY_DN11751_c0_g1_i1.p2 TRINITY_DN11751_c0_g1~~TRINITY_DN11751_c0_g1_i1.p2  ORF type:complete len:545 (+),score=102.13 TRINITY_DN11751_c0_g1_i1:3443-5077(+)
MGFVNKTILQFLVMALLRVQTGIACLCLVVTAIDNGIGKTPPMGWRSWNCYGHNINQSLMEATMDAMVATPHSLNGKPTSLKDLGYNNCGLDDNWQQCGAGIGGSFHDSKGNPIVNQDRFPDMKAMTDHGHSQGLKVGWYGNNCICRESNFPNDLVQAHYQGDVTAAVDFGYDGIKLDGCGEFLNLTLWADLLNKTGRMVMIENCHWGDTVPTQDWCPFNFYRSSGDIQANWGSVMRNLKSTIRFQDWDAPLSRPGCWAYPDMLEVGRLASFNEDRSHFGAWCIVSSPLILGFDLTNADTYTRVWSIISNTEAIQVNQQWAGHPGFLASSYSPGQINGSYVWAVTCSSDPEQTGWSYDSNKQVIQQNDQCLDGTTGSELTMATCNGSPAQQFQITSDGHIRNNATNKCVDVYDFKGPVVQLYSCESGTHSNQQFKLVSGKIQDGDNMCWAVRSQSPSGNNDNDIQIWAKPQPNNAVAVLVINNLDTSTSSQAVDIKLSDVRFTGSTANVRDIWHQKDIGTASDKFTTDAIDAHDSRFYLFTPQN